MADSVFSTVDPDFPGNSVNFMTGDLGGRVLNTSGATMTITKLGRWVRPGNSQSHTLKIWSSAHVLIDSVVVNCSGAPTNQFLYGTLSSPVNVSAGDYVEVTSTEVSGSELLCGPNVQTATQTDVGTLNPVTLIGGTWNYTINATRSYGAINVQYTAPVPTWSYNAGTNTYTTDGTFYQVKSAMAAAAGTATASNNATVTMPAGTFTYFVGASTLTIPPYVTWSGDSAATTTINMSTQAVNGFSVASVTINEGCIVRNMTINGPDANNCVPFITNFTAGTWRISHVNYSQVTNRSSYFINIQKAPTGLIDNCIITAGSGTSELILSRGPDDAWQQPAGLGDANAVYVEACTFGGVGQGYVNDANDNGKVVIRFCTMTGGMKIDGHGRASTSVRGVRRLEAYNNHWTYLGVGGWLAFEARGGENMLFNNLADISLQGAGFRLCDYGYLGTYAGFQGRYQTLNNYPILDQIGRGRDETVSVSQISAGNFVQIATVGTTVFTDYGAASNTPGIWFFATGTPTGSGTVVRNTAVASYIFGNLKSGSAWARTIGSLTSGPTMTTNTAGYSIGATSITLNTLSASMFAENAIAFTGDTNRYRITNNPTAPGPKAITIASPGLVQAIPASATSAVATPNTLYQLQQGSSSATFSEPQIILSNRDFYADAGFDTNTGVTVGTAAQKNATSAAGKTNQGFWVTDEGSWNTENNTPGTPGYQKGNGQLYVSNGTNWVLYYTPYTYPFSPIPPATPVFTSAEVRSAGTTLAITFSVSVSTGSGGAGGVTVAASGGAVTWTYSSGVGSTTYVGTLSRTIVAGEVVTVTYVQPGNGIESTSDGIDAPSFTAQPVSNNSSVNDTQATSFRPLAAISGGF